MCTLESTAESEPVDSTSIVELGGVLLDHDHGVVVDAGGVVARAPLLPGQVDLDRARGLARRERLAEVVEARGAKVGARLVGLCHDGAVGAHHEHVVHAEKAAVLAHLGVGLLEARVVGGDEGDALRLRLVYGVERLLVLGVLLLGLLEQRGELPGLLLHLGAVVGARELALHPGEHRAHHRDASRARRRRSPRP